MNFLNDFAGLNGRRAVNIRNLKSVPQRRLFDAARDSSNSYFIAFLDALPVQRVENEPRNANGTGTDRDLALQARA